MPVHTRDRSERSDDADAERSHDRIESVCVVLENGDVIVYDPDNHTAWVQSDETIDLEEHR
ncbi:MAG: hypothetical protein PPP58_02775 [Natronomonas sp.]